MSTVWVVDRYIDKVWEKKVRDVEKRDLWLSQLGRTPGPRFATREEAYKFLVTRAEMKLVEAEQEVERARARVKKCRSKLAPKPDPEKEQANVIRSAML